MSGAGKTSIAIPTEVAITITPEDTVTIKSLKGESVRAMHKDINIAAEDAQVVIARPSDVREHRVLHGLTRALFDNMVVGVSWGFSRTLELNGVGYRAQLRGEKLVMNLGYSYPVEVEAVDGVGFKLGGVAKVIVESIDKEKVGAVVANIKSWRKPGPYKGRRIEYSDEVIRRREGKTGK